jgi:hypothetical protein
MLILGKSRKDLSGRMDRHPAGRVAGDLIPNVIKKIQETREKQVSSVGQIWKQIVGERVAMATVVESFKEGTLYIKVSSASLYSMLSMSGRQKLIREFQEKLPSLGLINIVFRR